ARMAFQDEALGNRTQTAGVVVNAQGTPFPHPGSTLHVVRSDDAGHPLAPSPPRLQPPAVARRECREDPYPATNGCAILDSIRSSCAESSAGASLPGRSRGPVIPAE